MSKRLFVVEDEVSAAWRKAFAQPIMRHADHDPAVICRPAFGNGLCSPLLLAASPPPGSGDEQGPGGDSDKGTQQHGTTPGAGRRTPRPQA